MGHRQNKLARSVLRLCVYWWFSCRNLVVWWFSIEVRQWYVYGGCLVRARSPVSFWSLPAYDICPASGFREKDEKAWELKCDEIKKNFLEHGNTRNLPGYLLSWLTQQKRKFQENSLNHHKQERLESIGINLSDFKRRTTGDARKERDGAEWNKNLEKLKRYRELHGNCNVPRF